jgi:hypothetical protein
MASFARTWLIRGAILAVLAAAGYGVWVAAHWVGPEQVRAAVLARLHAELDGSVEVSLGSAHMRILGGLSISDLTLTRRGEGEPFLRVPHAVLYHDKQKLTRGELEIRKVELTGATVRVERRADGTWDVGWLATGGPAGGGLPTVVAREATVVVACRGPDAPPPVALREVTLTVLNDPLPLVKIDGRGVAVAADAVDADGRVPPGVLAVPVSASVRLHRVTKHLTAHLETGELEVGPDLAPLFARLHPRAAAYAQRFGGKVTVQVDLTRPGDTGQPRYDVRVGVRDGRFEDEAVLPWAIDQLAGTVRLADGRVSVEKMTGRLGKAAAELTLESKAGLLDPPPPAEVPGSPLVGPRWPPVRLAHRLLPPPPPAVPDDPMRLLEEKLERFEFVAKALSLDDDLFARLTPSAQKIRTMFNPTGAVDVTVRFSRPDGGWRREVDVVPRGLGIEYEQFRYPVADLTGHLRKVDASDGTDEFRVTVASAAGRRRLTLEGRVAGDGPDPLIDLTIVGTDVPIDDKLVAALPPKYAAALGKLRVAARGDFHITLRQELGVNRLDNTFKIHVSNGTANYTQFPYPLRQVRGDVLVKTTAIAPERPVRPGQPLLAQPDRDLVELRNFEAVHDGGRVWISGDNRAEPDTPDRRLVLQVQGENCPIDDDFKAALAAVKMGGVVRRFAPRGDLTFGADIEVWERGATPAPAAVDHPAADGGVKPAVAVLPAEPPFDPATDLKIAFHFRGPSVTPDFFPYDLHQLSGVLRYHHGRVELLDFAARHGQSTLKLGAADVRFADGGGVWANLGEIKVDPLVADAAFLRAMPGKLRSGFEQLNLRGPAELSVAHLVISVPGDEAKPPAPQPPTRGGEGEKADPFRGSGEKAAGLLPASALDRWRVPAPNTGWAVAALPPKAARPKPPDKPLFVTAAGLLPFALPWQRPTAPPPPAVEADPDAVVYWNATLKMTGGALDVGVPWDDVYGAIASEGRYEGTHLGAVVGTAWFDRATVAKQPVTAAKVAYRIRPQQPDPKRPHAYLPPVAEFRDLVGTAFGGTVGGEARVTLADPVRYRLWLTASGVRLEDVARHHKLGSGELKGLAQGDVLVENVPDAKTGKLVLTGAGQVDVPQGRMYNLPVLLELVKVLKGQTPDGVAFDEAHAAFELKGDRVKVTQLDLLGSAVSLGGSGELDTDGRDVRFEFYTIWSQTLRRWLATPLGDVTGLLSGGLFKIELTRVNGELTPKAHMLPAVTDPVRAVADRWRSRFGRDPAPPTVRGATR